jgi:hypothetical protein
MSDLEPLKRPGNGASSRLGPELLNRLQQAVETGNYHQIQMIAATPKDTLDSESRKKIELALGCFGDLVAEYVFESLPTRKALKALQTLAIPEAVSLVKIVCEVRNELDKIRALYIIPESKMMVLDARLATTHKMVAEEIVRFGSDLKDEFERAGRSILDRLRIEMARTPRDSRALKGLSAETISLFKQSCTLEDFAPRWKLGSDRRGYLRIAAKELTNHAGVPTEVPAREDKTAKKNSSHRRRNS